MSLTKNERKWILRCLCCLCVNAVRRYGLWYWGRSGSLLPNSCSCLLALGYDSIVCVGAIFLAASMGTAFSTINPFSVVIASNAAGIPFTEGMGFRTLGLILGGTCVIAYMYWYCKTACQSWIFLYLWRSPSLLCSLYERYWSECNRWIYL